MPPDRHGRTARADNDPRRRPSDGFRIRGAERFRRIVGDAVSALPDRFATALGGARLTVADVPPAPGRGNDDIPLAAFDGRVLTIYRRPVELRADNRAMLEETIMIAAAQAVARQRGWDDDIEDLFGG